METGIGAWTPPESLREIAGDDDDIIRELIGAFQADTASRLERLRQQLTAGDIAAAKAEAHTVKGSAHQMGATELAAICQEIELGDLSTALPSVSARLNVLESKFQQYRRAMTQYSIRSRNMLPA